ncbi:hypothetical protein [Clostridium saccharoperbutylacetonicum]
MKKFILATIVGTMLLSTSAFAATKTIDKSHTTSNSSPIHVQTENPGGW